MSIYYGTSNPNQGMSKVRFAKDNANNNWLS